MKKRLLASLLSATILLSMTPMAFADEEPVGEKTTAQTTQEEVAVRAEKQANLFDVDVENSYSDITVKSAVLADGILTIKVSYAKENQMAGIGYSYKLDGEEVTGRAIAQQIDGDELPQTNKKDINGYVRDCTVYIVPVQEGADEVKVTVDGLTTWTYDEESKTLTISGNGAMADFTYATIDDKNDAVDEQGLMSFPWAQYKNEVQKVVVEDGITRLGTQSFRKFFALTELIVNSDDLTEIGSTLCMNDSALKTVDLSACKNLSSVGDGVLLGMTTDAAITVKMEKPVSGLWVNSINYQKDVTTFSYEKGDNLINVDGWDVLLNGEECQLYAYTGDATDVVIPASISYGGKVYTVTSLDNGLFQNNDKIISISFAEGSKITAIPYRFVSCEDIRPSGHGNLTSVVLPSTIEAIGASAFASYSPKLQTFQIGSTSECIDLTGITSIDNMGLSNMVTGADLRKKDVKISDKLTYIGTQIFRNDTFNKLILTDGDYKNTQLNNDAFGMCYITNGMEMAANAVNTDAIIDAFLSSGNVEKFTQLYPNGESAVYTVDKNAKTVQLELSSGLNPENFQKEEWHGYLVLQSGVVEAGEWTIMASNIGGVKTCTITGYKGSGGEIEIPAEINGYTVKSIGNNVFKNNATITKVTFAADSQCEEIGDYAFAADSIGTSKLKEIVFPNSLKRIGKTAFFNCRALEQFPTLPDGLVTIDDQAFYNVTSAKTDLLVIPASVTRIGSQAFRWCGGIQRVQVKSEMISLGAQAFLLGTSSATNRYIDLSTVKNLTLDAEFNDGNNVKFAVNQKSGVSVIYVANDAIAAMLNDEVKHPRTFDKTKTCIVAVNGGMVAANPTGLSSVTMASDSNSYEVKWYTDADYATEVTDLTTLTAGVTYHAKWSAKAGSEYHIALIPDQTYTGEAITPAVTVLDNDGNALASGEYTVAYAGNKNVGTAAVTVTIGNDSAKVTFKIVKDGSPTITMPEVSVTYGTEYAMTPVAKTNAGNEITDGKIAVLYYTDSKCTKGETEAIPADAGTYYAKATLAETDNYASVSAITKIVIQNATFAVAAEGYSGVYDGQAHTITVTAADGAKVSYSKDDKTYGSIAPVFTDVGEYTVYYRVKLANHNDVNGSAMVNITKATPAITIKADPAALTGSGTVTLTVEKPEDGEVSVTCDKADVKVTANKESGTFSVTLPNSSETYTFTATVKYGENANYVDGTAPCTVTVTYQSTSHGGGGSSRNSSYAVSTPKADNGSVSVNNGASAKKGETVTITVKPNEGYEIDKVTVTDSKGNSVSVTDKGDGKYSFVMPDSKVDVKATFVKTETKPGKTTFVDVPDNSWYADAADFAAKRGLMSGVGENLFGGEQNTTRAMLMTILAKLDGQDVTGGATWYEKAMTWAKTNGVSDGTMPEKNITREQLATMLYGYAKLKGMDTTQGGMAVREFADYDSISGWAGQSMTWAVNAGILSGRGNNTLAPTAGATRAEMAVMLQQFVGLMEK